ncbi:hypothetical protein QAD02_003055 [Eretmocerus hayati]|uniref:Uncharacterized protein n=1 Tax=Eretmocerus hayati TaxID=131215 RepID=A0ACC2NL16_9HYME|nr:hypothetical protein QAD02_003055 [Eretmocerus hayati]
MTSQFIKFPSTREERLRTSQGYGFRRSYVVMSINDQCKTRQLYKDRKCRFLRTIPLECILRLMDCFVVKFLTFSEHDEIYWHHKHGTSINVQVRNGVCLSPNHAMSKVAGAEGLILNLRATAGSNHD